MKPNTGNAPNRRSLSDLFRRFFDRCLNLFRLSINQVRVEGPIISSKNKEQNPTLVMYDRIAYSNRHAQLAMCAAEIATEEYPYKLSYSSKSHLSVCPSTTFTKKPFVQPRPTRSTDPCWSGYSSDPFIRSYAGFRR